MDHRRAFNLAFPFAVWWLALSPALAETTPPHSGAPQPTLPTSVAPGTPSSPVVEQILPQERTPLVVHRQATRLSAVRRRIVRRIHVPRDLDRPALAGVELLAPLPPPGEPPHVTVPMPAFSLDSLAAAYTTPPPPIVCHRTRRDPTVPDPHLYREVPVECEPDNP